MKKTKKISIFLKWKLYFQGKKDGKEGVYELSKNMDGKYHTTFIDINMQEFQRIENEKFSDVTEEKLKELNKSIKNLKQQRDNVISNAKADISDLNHEIDVIEKKNSPMFYDKVTISAKEKRIIESKRKARNEIHGINKQGVANLGEANGLVKNFDVDFKEELSFCREKLTIYWASFFAKCKKRDPDTNINGQLPTEDELVTMYTIKNPSADFPIENYEIITIRDLEENNE